MTVRDPRHGQPNATVTHLIDVLRMLAPVPRLPTAAPPPAPDRLLRRERAGLAPLARRHRAPHRTAGRGDLLRVLRRTGSRPAAGIRTHPALLHRERRLANLVLPVPRRGRARDPAARPRKPPSQALDPRGALRVHVPLLDQYPHGRSRGFVRSLRHRAVRRSAPDARDPRP